MNISLDETWTFCINMAKRIAEETQRDDRQYVGVLKKIYLEQNHPDLDLYDNCFFCAYDDDNGCKNCPAVLVDSKFHCENDEYHYYWRPTDFHKELVRLNKKRKAK